MAVVLQLNVDERQDDRVIVSLVLAPETPEGAARIDGAAVGLVCGGEAVAPRTLLPLQGSLSGPMATTLELRSSGPIPEGTEIVATVWWGSEQRTASVPAHPCTRLVDHATGRAARAAPKVELAAVPRDRVDALATAFPGLLDRLRPAAAANVIDAADDADEVSAFQEAYGLDDDAAEWLRDLLDE